MSQPTTQQVDKAESALDLWFAERVWDQMDPIRLGSELFEVVCSDDEDVDQSAYDEYAILLRRMSDGAVFEVDLDVTMRPATTSPRPAEPTPDPPDSNPTHRP